VEQRIRSGAQPLAAARTAPRNNLTSGFGGHARPEAVAALANELARLKCPFHVASSALKRADVLKKVAGTGGLRPLPKGHNLSLPRPPGGQVTGL
jgi:hypothetical protein